MNENKLFLKMLNSILYYNSHINYEGKRYTFDSDLEAVVKKTKWPVRLINYAAILAVIISSRIEPNDLNHVLIRLIVILLLHTLISVLLRRIYPKRISNHLVLDE